jgi:hypothetical protein
MRCLALAASLLFLFAGLVARDGKPDPQLATGYIYVKQIEGVWWWIGPEGEKFLSLGVNHIEPHLWLAPYNKDATLDRYGQDMIDDEGRFDSHSNAAEKWINRQVEICEDLHFNTFGKHTHPSIDPSLYQDKIYYLVSLETAPVARWIQAAGEGPMPDVFSTEFTELVDKKARETCKRHRENPNLLGYSYTDIPLWILPDYARKQENEFVMIYPWVNATMKLGANSPGKQRWIAHLKDRYPSAEAAADVWGISYIPLYGISWDQLARLQTWFQPADLESADADMLTFLERIAEQWYAVHYKAIKEYDPNHLIIGDKNDMAMYKPFLMPALKKYVDVIAVQSYNPWSKDSETAAWIYEQTGKPIYNGDGSFSYVHPRQQKYKVKGWWTGARDLEDVARMYKESLERMMSTPYVIGWHHCGILQQWDEAERGDVDSNENGFLDPFENYYESWTTVIRKTNAASYRLHKNSLNE